MKKKGKKEKHKSTSPAVVVLANIRRETRIAALFPHERFSPSRLHPPHILENARTSVRT